MDLGNNRPTQYPAFTLSRSAAFARLRAAFLAALAALGCAGLLVASSALAACNAEQTATNEMRLTSGSGGCSSDFVNGTFKQQLRAAVAAMNGEPCDCESATSHSENGTDQRSPRQQALWNIALANASRPAILRMPGIGHR